jgi:hypothetical protein
MTPDSISPAVLRFIRERIDTVPHLEALLLVWESAPKTWTTEELTSRLYVSPDTGRRIVADLARHKLIAIDQGTFTYDPTNEDDALLPEVVSSYRRHLVQVARFIHSKGSTPMQEFARAFKLKKDEH